MSDEKVLLIAGDATLGQRVEQLLAERSLDTHRVTPGRDDVTPDGAFDAAYDHQVTSVVLIEPLVRYGGPPTQVDDSLLRAATRAARAPLVTGFGWVSSRDDSEALTDFQRHGKPYGVLHPSPLIEIAVDEGAHVRANASVLVDAGVASSAAEQGACSFEQAAQAIADWIASDGTRTGRHDTLSRATEPVQRAVRDLGFEPKVLAHWRVGLNGMLGMSVLDVEASPWRVRRKGWFRKDNEGEAGHERSAES